MWKAIYDEEKETLKVLLNDMQLKSEVSYAETECLSWWDELMVRTNEKILS